MTSTAPEENAAEQLLPCPFCGTQIEPVLFEIHPDVHQWVVRCPACGSQGATSGPSRQAFEWWNRRAAAQPMAADAIKENADMTALDAARKIIEELQSDSDAGETNELGENVLIVARALVAAEFLRAVESVSTSTELRVTRDAVSQVRVALETP